MTGPRVRDYAALAGTDAFPPRPRRGQVDCAYFDALTLAIAQARWDAANVQHEAILATRAAAAEQATRAAATHKERLRYRLRAKAMGAMAPPPEPVADDLENLAILDRMGV